MSTDEITLFASLRPEIESLSASSLATLRAAILVDDPTDAIASVDQPQALYVLPVVPLPVRRGTWLRWAAAAVLVSAVAGGLTRLRATDKTIPYAPATSTVTDPTNPTTALTAAAPAAGGSAENYLLVGTDSRANANPNDADYGGIVSSGSTVSGSRSDTMLVLRFDPVAKRGVLLSLPRDLRVTIADTNAQAKLNSAIDRPDHAAGVTNLIRTVQGIGIPINHYVEVDFGGFVKLIDALGGVRVHVDYPLRDLHTGLDIPTAACITMDGITARQYVRSRYMEMSMSGTWRGDGSSDIGRMARQQDFLKRALDQMIAKVATDPTRLSALLEVAKSSISVDAQTDVVALASTLKSLSAGATTSLTLPIEPSGAADLAIVPQEAKPVLDYFNGTATTISIPDVTPVPAGPGMPLQAPDPSEPFLPLSNC